MSITLPTFDIPSDHHYIWCPSNTTTAWQSNTISNFEIPLPSDLNLDGGSTQWLVGLVEIIYPNSFDNLSKIQDQNVILYNLGAAQPWLSFAVPAGDYDTVSDLIDAINAARPSALTNIIKFSVDLNAERISATFQSPTLRLRLSSTLAAMLGYVDGNFPLTAYGNIIKSEKKYDMRIKLHIMYVNANCASRSIVGDKMVQILRIVHLGDRTNFGTIISEKFANPIYLPVAQSMFRRLRFSLTTHTGEPVPFSEDSGNVILLIDFKRRY